MKHQTKDEESLAVSDVQDGSTISSPTTLEQWHPADPELTGHYTYTQISGSNADQPYALTLPVSRSSQLKINLPKRQTVFANKYPHATPANIFRRRSGRR
jgi:hypothetical protein